MGRHYFNLNYDVNAPCDDLTPIQLIYSGGVLNGIVWQHPTAMEGSRWESVDSFAISQIIDRPPQCLYDLAESVGVRTMHTYLRNYGTLATACQIVVCCLQATHSSRYIGPRLSGHVADVPV